MSRVEEIEAAISGLAPEDFRQLADWFHAREHALWDEQIDRDAAAGKLDFLFEEAVAETAAGLTRPWPPSE